MLVGLRLLRPEVSSQYYDRCWISVLLRFFYGYILVYPQTHFQSKNGLKPTHRHHFQYSSTPSLCRVRRVMKGLLFSMLVGGENGVE